MALEVYHIFIVGHINIETHLNICVVLLQITEASVFVPPTILSILLVILY